MKARWYNGAFIIILFFIGAVFQQQTLIPNQEIDLQFDNVDLSSSEAKNTITFVKKKLRSFGIENIQFREVQGRIKITYYSDTDIAIIKEALSMEDFDISYEPEQHKGNPRELPFDTSNLGFNLDIYEIQEGSDTERGLGGSYILEIEPKSDRFFNPNDYNSFLKIELRDKNNISRIAYNVRRNISLEIEDALGYTPDVRAGPSI